MLRLFAPFLPFATEEVWSWTHEGSVHVASWPTTTRDAAGVPADGIPSNESLLHLAGQALIGIRRAKTDAKASQKTPVASAVIAAPADALEVLERASDDLRAVGKIENLTFRVGTELVVEEIVFAPDSLS
jgi:valyl-tRNA synthetase